ncbi:urea carboxylase-associated family protein [Ascoidea rubescens DSM 1968]|uniref:Meiotic chromosome segregation protein n=1 Tax=Ascoidea rubescens DSM 1968 TaxID=1344418 RepID=A0A1D2VFK2_9ASCO|nr:meiotic chromosome segregation protein [Ascoidea rubescens DSM 1968]ODV60293.1 meiotic chromosome segregation protein [Ascoidea rubescens DSM 1968]
MSSQTAKVTKTGLPTPMPAYFPMEGSPLYADREFYKRVHESSKKLVWKEIVPIRSGKAWKVPKGHVCRITTPEGPQVGDLNIFNYHNPRERFWAARTRQLHSAHVSTYDRLWSNLPYLRPMATITGDSIDYGLDDQGGRCHDLLGTRCDPYVDKLLSGQDNDFHCHSNLTRAILPYGLTEFDVHDVLNVFQLTGLNENDQYFMETCPAKAGDYFEFFAEIDLLCALSTCPGGDLSTWGWGEGDEASGSKSSEDDMVKCCRPLGIELYEIDKADVLQQWSEPGFINYKGNHGLQFPVFNKQNRQW